MNARAQGIPAAPTRSLGALKRAMDEAETYEEWRQAALEHDERSGATRWKSEERSSRYGYARVRRRLDRLREMRAAEDPQELLFYLNEGIHGIMDGIG
jgi:NTE family protein